MWTWTDAPAAFTAARRSAIDAANDAADVALTDTPVEDVIGVDVVTVTDAPVDDVDADDDDADDADANADVTLDDATGVDVAISVAVWWPWPPVPVVPYTGDR